ncbi:hypothetical protein J1614_006762 [Plenodomus biglobosus]|nr:hypothetical protein J1614_006762 [Plenodomus biglobosus]
MKLATVTFALLTVTLAAELRPIDVKLTGKVSLDTRAEGKDTKKPKEEKKYKLAVKNHVNIALCDKTDLNGECFVESAPFDTCYYMENWTPNLAGKVTSLDVELGGLCFFFKKDKCAGEGKDMFGLNGGQEKDLAHFRFAKGEPEENLSNWIRSFYCTAMDTTSP